MNRPATFGTPSDTAGQFAARFTADEFLTMCEADAFAGMKVELVRGELQRMGPPMSSHASRQSQVIASLWAIARSAGLQVFGETGVNLGNQTIMACDAALIVHEIAGRRLVDPSEVLLAIEIAETTAARDTTLKRIAYAEAGIAHYWVVDGDQTIVHVYAVPIDGDYTEMNIVRFGEPLAVPGTEASIVID